VSDTVRERVMVALQAALSAALVVPPSGPRLATVERNALAPADLSALTPPEWVGLWDGAHEVAEDLGPQGKRCRLTLDVDLAVGAAIADSGDLAIGPKLNRLYGRTIAALAADLTLGGLVLAVLEVAFNEVAVNVDQGAAPSASGVLTLTVDFAVSATDPTAVAGGV